MIIAIETKKREEIEQLQSTTSPEHRKTDEQSGMFNQLYYIGYCQPKSS